MHSKSSFFFGFFLACLLPLSAHAIYLSESGDKAKLVGSIEPGDEKAFAEFLARPRASPLRVIYLDSFGGAVLSGIAIGRMIRKAGLATAVDATATRCVSSCTLIFAGGVKRYNIHGEKIAAGYESLSGLGYHGASLKSNPINFGLASDKGNELMANFYAEMGAPGAAALLAKGRGGSIYRPSGANSLALRIATSLGEP